MGSRVPYLMALIVALDQAAKLCVERWLPPGAQRPIWSGVLTLTHLDNPGVMLGWMGPDTGAAGGGSVAPAVSLVAIAWLVAGWACIQALSDRFPATLIAGLACFVGGSAGNTIDRLRLGYVIDFIGLPNGLVINLSDITIAAGALLICWALWTATGAREEAARKERAQAEARAGSG